MNVKANLEAVAQKMYSKAVKELDDSQLYFAILNMTKDMMKDKGVIKGSKKIYYISAEFLIGKLLSNNLINLGIYEELDAALKEEEKNLAASRRLSQNRLLETVDLADLQPAFWILSQALGFRETASA